MISTTTAAEFASNVQSFVSWFERRGGEMDSGVVGITTLPGYGRAAVALRDIPEGTTLFTIPRSITLSTRTSELPRLMGDGAWRGLGLDRGWVGLILCMMWEEARGGGGKWEGYLATLPTRFDTPMFWSAEEVEELRGTAVVDKIGRQDAENDYREKALPAIQSRSDLFPPLLMERYYSLERYHIMGSRILSRSFQVEKWPGEEEGEGDNSKANTSAGSAMDVDDPREGEDLDLRELVEGGSGEDGEEGEEEEEMEDVAMVPMADILNAMYGSENAKLFHEERDLKMIATKPIKAGDQIWNTYGDPPNSVLLRRYGHVDMIPLPEGGFGNPADVVEVRADLVVAVVCPDVAVSRERIDWWLDEGGDDVFVLEADSELPIPETFVSLTRLLLLPDDDWEKVKERGKPPKPKIDGQVLKIATDVLTRRLSEYPTSIQVDETLLLDETLSLNKRHAVIVRLGEKRVLKGAMDRVHRLLLLNGEKEKQSGKNLKRKGRDSDPMDGVSSRRSKR